MLQFTAMQDYSTDQTALACAHRALQNGSGEGSAFTGWVHGVISPDELARVKLAAARIAEDSRALVVIGIGGSYLGARGVVDCLCSPYYNSRKKSTPNIYFAGNGLDSAALAELLELVADEDFSVNIISKSGTTTEPAVAFRFFRELLEKKYGKAGAARRIYATTDRARGALFSLACAEGYERFVVPDDIGGRYSVLTAVGLLPIAACGVDIDALLAGAAEQRACCAAGDSPAHAYAAARKFLYDSGKKVEILASYDPSLRFFAEWWKQLYGESEGKNHRGLFPASVEFTADLHSMGQYIQDGERLMFETVVCFGAKKDALLVPREGEEDFLAGRSLDEIRACAIDGTLLAHLAGGVPNLRIFSQEKSAYALGELIYFFAYACGLSGYLLGVNPFDQPGVEAYKKNMFALLDKPGFETLGNELREKLKILK